MGTTRLSTKGQIILPRSVRDAREEAPDGILLRPACVFPETPLDEVAGSLKFKGKAKTLAQMEAAIGREVNRRPVRLL
jgi:hypothetical protein